MDGQFIEGFLEVPKDELDLKTTMEVGQTFSWYKVSGDNLYEIEGDRYYTTKDGDVLILWQEDDKLYYKATGGMEEEIHHRLRLDESLQEIISDVEGTDEVVDKAIQKYEGLRLLQDDFFPCLISYLCSPQMRIPRIKKMFNSIAESFGETVTLGDKEFLQFPTVEQLSEASEEDLRDLGVGYRAKYIVRTVEQLQEGLVSYEELKDLEYEEAHKEITKLFGVGSKVGDCVLLFSVGKMEAVPIDTWVKKAVKKFYPEIYSKNYQEMRQNFVEYFGNHVGYIQEYLFHYIRNFENVE